MKHVDQVVKTRHDWVSVRTPTETYSFDHNRIVGYNYNPYTTKQEYVTSLHASYSTTNS